MFQRPAELFWNTFFSISFDFVHPSNKDVASDRHAYQPVPTRLQKCLWKQPINIFKAAQLLDYNLLTGNILLTDGKFSNSFTQHIFINPTYSFTRHIRLPDIVAYLTYSFTWHIRLLDMFVNPTYLLSTINKSWLYLYYQTKLKIYLI